MFLLINYVQKQSKNDVFINNKWCQFLCSVYWAIDCVVTQINVYYDEKSNEWWEILTTQ